MTNFDVVFKCEMCEVPAKGVQVNGEYERLECPLCGVNVVGEECRNVAREQIRYYLVQRGREIARRQSESHGFRYEGGDEPIRPSGPFFLDTAD